jgi:hypothetical protein
VRRSPRFPLSVRPEQRRTRLLTTLTLVAGAATIAAVTATSSSEPTAPTTTATQDPAESAAGAVSEVPDPAADRSPTGALDTLAPLTGERSHGELDARGAVERVAEVEPLPTLRTQAEQAEQLVYVAADGTEVTPERIRRFLDGRGAPLAEHAELFVEAGLRHDVDPRVVVAISIAESNGGKMHPEGTHNVWGWGGSGGPSGLRAWASWDEAIDTYTERLGALYDTDHVDWEFASTYCPPNTQWWYDTVTWAIAQI